MSNTRSHVYKIVLKIFGLLFFIFIYLVTSIDGLYVDVINPDGINWHTRTTSFTKALSQGRYSDTFQAYHPGTTIMWISGPLLSLFTQNASFNQPNASEKATFLDKDYYAKLSLVVFSLAIFIISFVSIWKLVSYKFASFFSVLLVLEPFVIGTRRLYHLDFLMTELLFLSFILLIYYYYKSSKIILPILSALFLALSILTKSAAVMFLPSIPFIALLGNIKWQRKLSGTLVLILSLLAFTYMLFPPIWRHPFKDTPKYFEKILFGVSEIGVMGKQEMGFSGKNENIVLDDLVKERDSMFYILSLGMRLSIMGGFILLISLSGFIYVMVKRGVMLSWSVLRQRKIPKYIDFSADSWLAFWAACLSIAFLLALTLSTKKSDRYEIVMFPFIFCVCTYFLNKLHVVLGIVLAFFYFIVTCYELNMIRPYYFAYSNPYFGGVRVRLYTLDDAPFGVGSYQAVTIARNDMAKNDYNGYFTISGSKSVKAIGYGGKFSRSPSCVTDYVITYALDQAPLGTCQNKYSLIGTVKVGGFDYWYVFKRLNQKHESNYD